MPGCPRPNLKAMKIAFTILKTPKAKQQQNKKPTPKMIKEWFRDSSAAQ